MDERVSDQSQVFPLLPCLPWFFCSEVFFVILIFFAMNKKVQEVAMLILFLD